MKTEKWFLLFHYVQIVYYLSQCAILSKNVPYHVHKRWGCMDEKKENEELIKFKKQWFNEDNQTSGWNRVSFTA